LNDDGGGQQQIPAPASVSREDMTLSYSIPTHTSPRHNAPIARGDFHYATQFQFSPSWCSPVTKSRQNAPQRNKRHSAASFLAKTVALQHLDGRQVLVQSDDFDVVGSSIGIFPHRLIYPNV